MSSRTALVFAEPQRIRVFGKSSARVELRGPAPGRAALAGAAQPSQLVRDRGGHLQYGADLTRYPTFPAQNRREMIGFGTVRRHYGSTRELRCLATHADWLGMGLGTRLLRKAEGRVRAQAEVSRR